MTRCLCTTTPSSSRIVVACTERVAASSSMMVQRVSCVVCRVSWSGSPHSVHPHPAPRRLLVPFPCVLCPVSCVCLCVCVCFVVSFGFLRRCSLTLCRLISFAAVGGASVYVASVLCVSRCVAAGRWCRRCRRPPPPPRDAVVRPLSPCLVAVRVHHRSRRFVFGFQSWSRRRRSVLVSLSVSVSVSVTVSCVSVCFCWCRAVITFP